MIPRILHSVWLGDPMSERLRGFDATFKNHNPSWTHMRWDENTLSKLGLSMESLARLGSFASMSNLVRLLAVHKHGGIYADSDCECLKPLDPLLEYSAFAALQDDMPAGQNVGRICNAVFGAAAGHPWISWQVNNSSLYENTFAAWAVYLMSEAPRHDVTIIPTRWVYPFHWDAPPEKQVNHPESFIRHEWDGTWV